jgi:phosphoenolpyruvate phosphomutase
VQKSKLLRDLFASDKVVRIVGAHNAIGAKLAQRNGFEGIWASGLEISTAHGVPDANILSMSDFLIAAHVMNDATSLPVICDCDTGFGNAANVQYLVKKYEAAGIAAIVIEDKVFPKVNSFIPGRQDLAPMEEFMGKIQAAKDAQKSVDFMVFARVEALIAGWGMEEALRRANAYYKAGADGIVIHSKMKTPDEIYEFAHKWNNKIPLVAIPTTYPSVTASELKNRGFKMVIYANQGLRASLSAIDKTFASIARDDSSASIETGIASMREVFELQGMPTLKENERKYTQFSVRGVILSAADHRIQPGLSQTLKDSPLCMVDIGGKPLLARQMEVLQACGVNNVTVVGGHLADKIRVEGADVLTNKDYLTTGIMHSFMSGTQDSNAPCVLIYGDVIHDQRLIEQLLKSPHAITIVIDRAYRTLPSRDKKVDLVYAEHSKADGGRNVSMSAYKNILSIGAGLDPSVANYEFAGIALFKSEGLTQLRQTWQKAKACYDGNFYGSTSLQKADLNDFFQYMIDEGISVYGLEVEHGWSEIHSASDLERVRKHFCQTAQSIHV